MITWLSFCVLSVFAAVSDIRTRRIPYWLTLPLFGIAWWIGSHRLTGLLTLTIFMGGFVLFRRYGRLPYGDADAVLLAAFAAVLGWPAVAWLLVWSGGIALWMRRTGAFVPYIVAGGLPMLMILHR